MDKIQESKSAERTQIDSAIARYEIALDRVDESVDREEGATGEVILELLLARDRLHEAWSRSQLGDLSAKRIVELDNRLRQQSAAIANHRELKHWQQSLNPPESFWWWQLSDPVRDSLGAIADYERALRAIETDRRPSSEAILELLAARDRVESVRDRLPKAQIAAIVELDRRLKQQRLTIARGNQLIGWRNTLKPPADRWWWYLNPTLIGSEEEPASLWDWLCTGISIGCLAIAASFTVSTYEVFKSNQQIGRDLAQHLATIAQAGGLVLVTGGAVTKQGQKIVENILISARIPPRWQGTGTLMISSGLLLISWGIYANLPKWGIDYFNKGENLAQIGQYSQAIAQYRQAQKFPLQRDLEQQLIASLGRAYEARGELEKAQEQYQLIGDRDRQADLMVGLARHYEDRGQLDRAKSIYEKFLNNARSANALGRVLLLEGLQQVGWTGKLPEADVRQAEFYFELVEHQLSQHDNFYSEQLHYQVALNKGILRWAQVDLAQPKSEDLIFLLQAYGNFQEAFQVEQLLPTTADGGRAKCYLEIAGYLLDRFHNLQVNYRGVPPHQACYDRINALYRSDFIHDLELMDAAIEVNLKSPE
jgi:tetratricopeptide (TPR) repeat protein